MEKGVFVYGILNFGHFRQVFQLESFYLQKENKYINKYYNYLKILNRIFVAT